MDHERMSVQELIKTEKQRVWKKKALADLNSHIKNFMSEIEEDKRLQSLASKNAHIFTKTIQRPHTAADTKK